jgi:hypothetical protein
MAGISDDNIIPVVWLLLREARDLAANVIPLVR